jgi:UDP-2,3-diacylglucosamine pyrophosphatase LpxH
MIKTIFQIISDIHLEFLSQNDVERLFNKIKLNKSESVTESVSVTGSVTDSTTKSTTDLNIILAGDIGHPSDPKYENFLQTCTKLYDNVFLITGNHEYYQSEKNSKQNPLSVDEINQMIEEICSNINSANLTSSSANSLANPSNPSNKFGKIHFLNNKMILYNNIYIIGSTLWSYVDPLKFDTKSYMNDYNYIKDFTPELSNELWQKNRKFISDSVGFVRLAKKTDPNIRCLVITHHLPSFHLIHPKYKSCTDINHFFASDMDDLITEPVDYWIYGHTHMASKIIHNGVNLICNPLGYTSESSKFDNNCLIKFV